MIRKGRNAPTFRLPHCEQFRYPVMCPFSQIFTILEPLFAKHYPRDALSGACVAVADISHRRLTGNDFADLTDCDTQPLPALRLLPVSLPDCRACWRRDGRKYADVHS